MSEQGWEPRDPHSENIEIQLLLEAIYIKYGYDFKAYSRASITRRIKNRLSLSGLPNISALQHKIIYDEACFRELLVDLSINVTEMFRDPELYSDCRQQVLPQLLQREHLKIWHAGCSSGEEVYSMAILLKEEGLYDRCQIYATDFNEKILMKARDGVFESEALKTYENNYTQAGGKKALSDYYHMRYKHCIMDKNLRRNITFSDHNLVVDGVFGEMDLIVCRNVLIYFTKKLQDHVLDLFCDSLAPDGFLVLGTKETVRFSSVKDRFSVVSAPNKIYRFLG